MQVNTEVVEVVVTVLFACLAIRSLVVLCFKVTARRRVVEGPRLDIVVEDAPRTRVG